jgi:hypothetical protein
MEVKKPGSGSTRYLYLSTHNIFTVRYVSVYFTLVESPPRDFTNAMGVNFLSGLDGTEMLRGINAI